MKSSVWGPITWNLLHTIAEKVYIDKFENSKNDIFKIISMICISIPCPICRENAINYLNKNKISNCNTKEALKDYVFNLHNEANIHANNPIKDKTILKQYENLVFSNTFFSYYNLYKNNRSDDITYSFRKNINLKDIHNLLIKNTHCFTY